MGEFDFIDNLVSISHFGSTHDASIASTKLESFGICTTLEDDSAGINLLVRQGDYRRAKEILAELNEHKTESEEPLNDSDAEDWSGEDWADDDDYEDEEYTEEPTETPPAIRAWRAAVIGTIFLPLNVYSWWLIFRHELWYADPNNKNPRWRFIITLIFNLVGLLFFWALCRYWLR